LGIEKRMGRGQRGEDIVEFLASWRGVVGGNEDEHGFGGGYG
jgi:hypothetical protein